MEALDLREARLAQQALEAPGGVSELRRPPRVRGLPPLVPVKPVRLGQQETAARPQRSVRRAEVEILHIADLEPRVETLGRCLLAGDLDHLRRDVVPDRLDSVADGEASHPARPAAELAEAHARLEVEQLDDVAEVDDQAGRLARGVAERLRP